MANVSRGRAMSLELNRIQAASVLAGAGIAWPTVMCAVRDAMLSPLDRALLNSWCGGSPHEALLSGHCALCVAGAVGFLTAALLTLAAPLSRPVVRPSAA